jgi:hypothetical protein
MFCNYIDIKIILKIAKPIPIQFFLISFSLNRKIPAKVDSVTMETLLIAKIPELSKMSLRNVFTKK